MLADDLSLRIAAAVAENLGPIVREMKEDINSMKREMANLSEAVSTLSGEVKNHKNETASEIRNLQLSFQDMIDNPPIEAVSLDVLIRVVPYMNSIKNDLREYLEQLARETSVHELSQTLDTIKFELSNVSEEMGDGMERYESLINTRMNEVLRSLEMKSISISSRLISCMENKVANLSVNFSDLIIKMENLSNTSSCTDSQLKKTTLTNDFTTLKEDLTIIKNMTQVLCNKVDEHSVTTKEIAQNVGYTCGGTGGWRRAVYLDMANPRTSCPSGWQLTTRNSKRTCGRVSSGEITCDSAYFPVIGGPYSEVCGTIRAYQWGVDDGFLAFNQGLQITIESAYFSGVAVMHGSPRQHIWSFVAGAWENDMQHREYNCPCDTSGHISIPPFVGEDYFCEAGYVHPRYESSIPLYNDTLWDGKGCHRTSSCCSFHNPPYFYKSLDMSTSDSLELRMCNYDSIDFVNKAVELVELYVR